MSLLPLNGRVMVKPAEPDEEAGGVYLPETAREEGQTEGEVVAVADDATEEVAVGDRVIYSRYAGTEITDDDEDYVLLTSEEILARHVAADKILE